MKKYTIISSLIFAIAFLTGCEKVIEIPLNEADRQIVVEAVARNFMGESYILLSRSGSVYDDSGFEKISGAIIKVVDQDGVETIFTEDLTQEGKYVSASFQAQPFSTYQATVIVEDQTLTATSTSLSVPALDSLTYINTGGGFGAPPGDTTYLLFYNFIDNADEVNYYQVSAWVNGVPDETIYIGNDVLGNGQLASAPLFATEIKPKDTVYVELRSFDEVTYTFLSTLSSNLNSGPFSATPANPVSNIYGGLGYFGTYMVDTLTIIMP